MSSALPHPFLQRPSPPSYNKRESHLRRRREFVGHIYQDHAPFSEKQETDTRRQSPCEQPEEKTVVRTVVVTPRSQIRQEEKQQEKRKDEGRVTQSLEYWF